MEIDKPKLRRKLRGFEMVEKHLIPDIAVRDVLAITTPRLGRWRLCQLAHACFPRSTDFRKRPVGTENDVSDLVVFQVTSLGENEDIGSERREVFLEPFF